MRKKEGALFPRSDWVDQGFQARINAAVEQGFKTSFLSDWCSAVLDGRDAHPP
jgi:hypothetical protein